MEKTCVFDLAASTFANVSQSLAQLCSSLGTVESNKNKSPVPRLRDDAANVSRCLQ